MKCPVCDVEDEWPLNIMQHILHKHTGGNKCWCGKWFSGFEIKSKEFLRHCLEEGGVYEHYCDCLMGARK